MAGMPPFWMNEGAFEVEEGWHDQSVTALSFPAGVTPAEASLTVTREPLGQTGNGALGSYIDRQLIKLAKTCPDFELVARTNSEISAKPSQTIEFTWRTPDGAPVRQRQTVVANGPVALVFTATSKADRFERFATLFEKTIASFQFRQ